MGAIAAGVIGAGLMIGGGVMGAGKKVRIPAFQRVDPTGEQAAAIAGNLANFEQGAELARKTSMADQSTLEAMLRRAIPGYDNIIKGQSALIQSRLSGELPSDVSRAVSQSAAGRAMGMGIGGSGLGRNLTARDLGITSMDIQNQGFTQALNFIQSQRSAGMVNPMSVSSMFVTPQQRMEMQFAQNQAEFQRNLMQAQVAAQPDPMMAAIGGSFSNIGGMLLGGAMGGGMGGGGGGGQQQTAFNPVYQPVNFGSSGGYYQPGSFSYGGPSGGYQATVFPQQSIFNQPSYYGGSMW